MIIVLGLPGVGKSTVLEGIAQAAGYKSVNYGTMMLEIAKRDFGVEHRDKIRALDAQAQAKIQAAVAKELEGMKGKIILDTHCSIQTQGGYLPGLPFSLLGKLRVERLVYVTAPADQIAKRREKDAASTGRVRPVEKSEIEEHEAMNKAYLAAYSAFLGVPALVIENLDGGLEAARKKLAGVL
ncbi:adenylate kinase [Candidatus Parvarchaeota archaeon]|nr:adenylate kinase [Candidatus Parvarchaeota archaeon]